jgi:hypothetical protein
MLCGSETAQRFGGKYHLHLQVPKSNPSKRPPAASVRHRKWILFVSNLNSYHLNNERPAHFFLFNKICKIEFTFLMTSRLCVVPCGSLRIKHLIIHLRTHINFFPYQLTMSTKYHGNFLITFALLDVVTGLAIPSTNLLSLSVRVNIGSGHGREASYTYELGLVSTGEGRNGHMILPTDRVFSTISDRDQDRSFDVHLNCIIHNLYQSISPCKHLYGQTGA